MNSLISLLWQFEIPNIPIPTTILKNNQQTPHHYFYSQKQGRVLRKKNPNAVAAIEQSQGSQSKKEFPLLLNTIRNLKQKTIQLKLSTGSAAIEQLTQKEFQGQYSIIPSNYQLCLYTSINNAKPVIQYLTCPQPSRHESIFKVVSDFSNNLCKIFANKKESMNKFAKNSSNEVTEMILLIGVNLDDINGKFGVLVIEAIKLKFWGGIQDLIQIRYSPKVDQISFQTKNFKQKNNTRLNHMGPASEKQQTTQKQQKIPQIIKEEESPDKPTYPFFPKNQKTTYSSCTSCNQEYPSNKMKQVPNQQYKRLRKLKNMSIRGFNQQYYEICLECYQLL